MAHSPVGDNLPLREYSLQYQPSPSPLASQATSPPPESASSIPLSQIDNESAAFLSWQDITVTMVIHQRQEQLEDRNNQQQIVLLDGISGCAEPYRMLTIMGPSKSGKSTLLHTISGKLCRKAKFKGDIRINGRRQQLTYGTSAFLTTDDVLPDNLTLKEHLYLSAYLRLPSSLPRKEKVAVAEHIMSEMGLTDIAYRYIKTCSQKGISAGQRRLVNLATELLIGPSLIYFDDALKDLEGSSALSLLVKLKGLSRGGCTVIMCVEHVSSHIYELLDDLCLLSSGKMVYFGDSNSALEHFSTAGFPCPALHNPGDHFLYTIGSDYEKLRASYLYVQDMEKAEAFASEDNQQIVQFLSSSYQNSDFYAALLSKINSLVRKKGAVLVNRTRHPAVRLELFILGYRSLLNTTRSLGFHWLRIFLSFLFMLSLATIFLKLDHSRSSIEARASCIFLALEGILFLSIVGVPYMCKEIKMHVLEMANCQYGIPHFMVASSLAALPFLLLNSLLPLCTMYFLVGLHSGVLKFIYFVINLYLSLIVSESLVMAISSAASNTYVGMILVACIQVLFMLSAGYIHHRDTFPQAFWKYPLHYISFHAHSLRGMFENEFVGSRFGAHSGTFILNHEYNIVTAGPGKWWTLLILSGMAVFFRILSIATIHRRCGSCIYHGRRH